MMKTFWNKYWLFLLASIGIYLLFFRLPAEHIDSIASQSLGTKTAGTIATKWLHQNGYDVSSLNKVVVFERNVSVLDSLQASLGRRNAIEHLKKEENNDWPTFAWRITFRHPKIDNQPAELWYQILLSQKGEVFYFENKKRADAGRRINRLALSEAVLSLDTTRIGSTRNNDSENIYKLFFADIPDSMLAEQLVFDASDETFDAKRIRAQILNASTFGTIQPIPQSLAGGYAKFYLKNSILQGLDMLVDTITTVPGRDNAYARVSLQSVKLVGGIQLFARVDVRATGTLYELATNISPDQLDLPLSENWYEGNNVSVVVNGIRITIFAMLIIWVLVGFFRRLQGRLIDAGAALRDTLMVVFYFMIAVGLTIKVSEAVSTDVQVLFSVALMLLMVTGAIGFISFVIAGATDSLAREVWEDKISSLSYVRKGAWFNHLVGNSLIHGIALAFTLFAISIGALVLFPDTVIMFDDNRVPFVWSITSMSWLFWVANAGWFTLLVLHLILLGIGSTVYRRTKSKVWFVVTIAIILGVSKLAIWDVGPLLDGMLISAVSGAVIAIVFLQYDYLTTLVGYFFFFAIWFASSAFLVEGSPAYDEFVLLLVCTAGVAIFGLAGVIWGPRKESLPEYIPKYVNQLAHEQQLHRELEIARQVQESFLPAEMPTIKNLDLAAQSQPAEVVGGDYYDFIQLSEHRWAVIIGDVSGKGIQAAFYMTLVKGFLHPLAKDGNTPADVIIEVNKYFCNNAEKGTFITLIYGIIDTQTGTFDFARAGHNPLYVRRKGMPSLEIYQPSGLAIGFINDGRFKACIENAKLKLSAGDSIILFTDGFPEAMNEHREQVGDERFEKIVSNATETSATAFMGEITRNVSRFVEKAERHDDMTLVILTYQ